MKEKQLRKPGRPRMFGKTAEILLNVDQAAMQFGVSKASLRNRLANAGHDVGVGKTFGLRDLYRALAGDWHTERTRKLREEADALARERMVAEKELLPQAEVQDLVAQSLGVLRERIAALPAAVCHRANPSDPEHARAALRTWSDDTLRAGREAVA